MDPTIAAQVAELHGDPSAYAKTVASSAPVPATPSARSALNKSGNPTGELRVPTITMHTEYDPVALASDETILRNRVAANGRGTRLMQLYIAPSATYNARTGPPYGISHCAFAARQMTGLIGALDTWVRTGTRPSEPDLTRDIGPGFDPHFRPPIWPSGARR